MPAGNLVTTTETTTAEQKVVRRPPRPHRSNLIQVRNHWQQGYSLPGRPDHEVYVACTRAAEILGMRAPRLRRWADRGLVPVVIDQDGFRHYLLSEIEEIARSGRLAALEQENHGPRTGHNAPAQLSGLARVMNADGAIAAPANAGSADPSAAASTTQILKQKRTTTTRIDPHALDGATAADLFDRFDRGEPLVRIVIDRQLPPETVARAHGEFHRLLGRVALDPDQVQAALSVLRHFGAIADAVPGTAPAPLGDQLVAAIAKLHAVAVKKDTAACEVCATLGRDEPKRAVRCLEHSKLPRGS